MSLFQRRPSTDLVTPYYSMSTGKTILIVALGNPGAEYDNTRHNVGFAALDKFASSNEFDNWILKKDLKGYIASKNLGSARVILLKPTTFMNLSGEAVQATAQFYKIAPEDIVVVHDELDIDFGQIRTRIGGSAAGHNGIKSVSKHIGEQYGRVRIGVGPKNPPQIDSADFVLARFSTDEQGNMNALINETVAILNDYLFSNNQLPTETRSFLV